MKKCVSNCKYSGLIAACILILSSPCGAAAPNTSTTSSGGTRVWRVTESCSLQETSMGVDSAGNIYAAGWCSSPGVRLLKLNSSGSVLWQLMLPDANRVGRESVAIDRADNIIVAATSKIQNNETQGLVYKFNSAGSLLWQKPYSVPGQYFGLEAVAVDASNNIYTIGSSSPINGATLKILTTKLDNSGNLLWTNDYVPSINYGGGCGMAVTDSFLYSACSNQYAKRSLATGELLWERRGTIGDAIVAGPVTVDSAKNVYFLTPKYQAAYSYHTLLKYAPDNSFGGRIVLQKGSDNYLNDIAFDSSSAIYATGFEYSGKGAVIYTSKFGAAGNLMWQAVEGKNTFQQAGYSLAVNSQHVYAAGNYGTSSGPKICVVNYVK